jgi:hypothetical protein
MSIRGICLATGSHFQTLSGLLMRIPIKNMTKSPLICAVMRCAITPLMLDALSFGFQTKLDFAALSRIEEAL